MRLLYPENSHSTTRLVTGYDRYFAFCREKQREIGLSFRCRRTEAWFALGSVARGKVASHGLLRINLGVTVVCKQANGLRQPSAGGRALVRPAGKALERIPARKMPLIPASRLHAMLARCIIELPLLKTK